MIDEQICNSIDSECDFSFIRMGKHTKWRYIILKKIDFLHSLEEFLDKD